MTDEPILPLPVSDDPVRQTADGPDWRYVEMRRYVAFVEHSLDQGTQWVVFEPNGAELWARVRSAVEDFLLKEWQAGALKGPSPAEAFYVRCDQTTMTQNDLDNGRLVCVVGIAPTEPAEFVVIQIGQWTAGRKC